MINPEERLKAFQAENNIFYQRPAVAGCPVYSFSTGQAVSAES